MTKTLTVHNAEIHTAAVEVKTLTIKGKQVTLAVFRQLQEEPLIDHDGNFRGLPWGTVNYHVNRVAVAFDAWRRSFDKKNCETGSAHVHVVWQHGQELRRSLIWHPNVIHSLTNRGHGELADLYAKSPHHGQGRVPGDRWAEIQDLPQLFIAV